MGREIRRVPADWQHPKQGDRFERLFEGPYEGVLAEHEEEKRLWGLRACEYTSAEAYDKYTFEEYHGEAPDRHMYMPSWTEEQKTHIMMYETTSEGTPISPAFETPEELARWLADNGASSFAGSTATYEQWLGMCESDWAPSMVIQGGVIQSGVAALNSKEQS